MRTGETDGILIDQIMPAFYLRQRDLFYGAPIRKQSIQLACKGVHIREGSDDDTQQNRMVMGFFGFITYELYHHKCQMCEVIQSGLDAAFDFYEKELDTMIGLADFACLRNIYEFREEPAPVINSRNLLPLLKASVWCMVVFTSEKQALQQTRILFRTGRLMVGSLITQMYDVYRRPVEVFPYRS